MSKDATESYNTSEHTEQMADDFVLTHKEDRE